MPITPTPSWAPTIRLATAAPWPLVKSEMPDDLTMLFCRVASPTTVMSSRPMVVCAPLPCWADSVGLQFTDFIHQSTWSVPEKFISPSYQSRKNIAWLVWSSFDSELGSERFRPYLARRVLAKPSSKLLPVLACTAAPQKLRELSTRLLSWVSAEA